MTAPLSLLSDDLNALWDRVRIRLEARGIENHGRLRLPELSSHGRHAIQSLIGRSLGKTIDLGALETGLIRLEVGTDLATALACLGHPISTQPAERRAERTMRRNAHAAARREAEAWAEPWAKEWIDGVIRTGVLRGFDSNRARDLVSQVRAVLDRLGAGYPGRVSRVDLAAQTLGSAHALDTGTRLEAAVARALSFRVGPASSRELWEQASVHLDLTSAPALTWGLGLVETCALSQLVGTATDAGVPLHLSRLALEQYPVAVSRGTAILVVENPRIAEAAAQARSATAVVSTNGQPSSTVLLLLEQLAEEGAVLRYNGDFDVAGLAICARMAGLGLIPWRMEAKDYRAALTAADTESAQLPIDEHSPGTTPWDPALQTEFDRHRRIVHQERLLPSLISLPLT